MKKHSAPAVTVLLITTLLVLAAARATAGIAEDLGASIDARVAPLVASRGGLFGGKPEVVGVVVGVIRDGEQAIFSYGKVDHDSEREPDGETLFEIGSLTKTFTGALLADAIARGDVSLEDPIRRHLPEKALPRNADRGEIILRHLATHSSGLPRLPSNLDPKSLDDPYADFAPEDLWHYLAKRGLARKNDRWEYSNLGAGLLGQLLVEVAGAQDYESLVLERICRPLGMTDCRATWRDEDVGRRATPYRKYGKRHPYWRMDALSGAGALHASMNDMLRWASAHLAAAAGTGNPVLAASHEELIPVNGEFSSGMFWIRLARGGFDQALLFHDGRTGGFSSAIFLAPGRRSAVVILANTASQKLNPLGEELLRLVAGVPES